MDIFISRGAQDPEVRIRFPAEPDIVWPMLRELDEYCANNDPFRIVGTSALDPNLTQYISCADVEDAADIRKLSELAELVDGMSTEEQRIFAGALGTESVNSLNNVLEIASNLGHYEFIEGVTCDKDLGGWLVEHGQAGVEFPEAVRPYLDYAGIGGSYYASHGGAYTLSGYVKRREVVQEQTVESKPKFSLTLTSHSGTVLSPKPLKRPATKARRIGKGDYFLHGETMDLETFCEEYGLDVPDNPIKFEMRPASPDEAGLFYALPPGKDEELGTIGHVRIDFGRDGDGFWHTWWPRGPEELNTPEFKDELGQVVDQLRRGVLKDFSTMLRLCHLNGGEIAGGIAAQNYGFVLETERYRYCLRCNPVRGDYQAYLTCFDLRAQEMRQAQEPEQATGPEMGGMS